MGTLCRLESLYFLTHWWSHHPFDNDSCHHLSSWLWLQKVILALPLIFLQCSLEPRVFLSQCRHNHGPCFSQQQSWMVRQRLPDIRWHTWVTQEPWSWSCVPGPGRQQHILGTLILQVGRGVIIIWGVWHGAVSGVTWLPVCLCRLVYEAQCSKSLWSVLAS